MAYISRSVGYPVTIARVLLAQREVSEILMPSASPEALEYEASKENWVR
jgi:hypothetical protein